MRSRSWVISACCTRGGGEGGTRSAGGGACGRRSRDGGTGLRRELDGRRTWKPKVSADICRSPARCQWRGSRTRRGRGGGTRRRRGSGPPRAAAAAAGARGSAGLTMCCSLCCFGWVCGCKRVRGRRERRQKCADLLRPLRARSLWNETTSATRDRRYRPSLDSPSLSRSHGTRSNRALAVTPPQPRPPAPPRRASCEGRPCSLLLHVFLQPGQLISTISLVEREAKPRTGLLGRACSRSPSRLAPRARALGPCGWDNDKLRCEYAHPREERRYKRPGTRRNENLARGRLRAADGEDDDDGPERERDEHRARSPADERRRRDLGLDGERGRKVGPAGECGGGAAGRVGARDGERRVGGVAAACTPSHRQQRNLRAQRGGEGRTRRCRGGFACRSRRSGSCRRGGTCLPPAGCVSGRTFEHAVRNEE